MGGLALVLLAAMIAVPVFLNGQVDQHPVGVDAFAQQRSAVEPTPPNFWGPAYQPALREPYVEAPDGERLVQYFDKARMEQTNPGGPVTSGLLTVELITGQRQFGDTTFVAYPPANIPVVGDATNTFPTYAALNTPMLPAITPRQTEPNGTVFNANGTWGYNSQLAADPGAAFGTYQTDPSGTYAHTIPAAFHTYLTSLPVPWQTTMGFPLTEAFWVNVLLNNTMTWVMVQPFERRVLSYTPTNPALFRVEMGNIGQHYYRWRYILNPGGMSGPPTATPAPALPATMTPTPTPLPTETPVPSIAMPLLPTATTVPPTATATAIPASERLVLGVNASNPNRASKIDLIDQYTQQVGTMPKVVHYYLSWSDGGPFDRALNDAIVARGATPMLTWNPQDWRYGVTQPAYTDAVIASGVYDALLRQWGHDLDAWGKPFYLRIGDEMNGDWDPWSPGVNSNTVATYIAMWRHVVTTMRAAGNGLPNVRFIWCPGTVDQGAADFTPMYPGDAYVDWIGLDGFNWGTETPNHHLGWQSFSDVFQQGYARITALTTKPLMIAEIGSVEKGGDKAAWLTQTFLTDIPTHYPRIRAVIYFDSDDTSNGEGNWLVNTSPASLAAWQRIVNDPRYQGRLP